MLGGPRYVTLDPQAGCVGCVGPQEAMAHQPASCRPVVGIQVSEVGIQVSVVGIQVSVRD